MHIRHVLLIAMAMLLAPSGCDFPRDPEGTLERVREGRMRVGVSENEPWTSWRSGSPSGIEVELVKEFAAQQLATIDWERDAESKLLEALRKHELDLVIGGLTDDTPWADKIGATQPYYETDARSHVIAVSPGENEWLLALEKFLHSRREEIHERVATETRR